MRSGTENGTGVAPRRGRPPGSNSDATRHRILMAACECFGARGYEATTNAEIGERAGVTAAAIYRYFDSKQLLYVAAVAEAHREIVPFFRAAVPGAATARAGLVALARAYVDAYDRFPALTPFLSGVAVEMHRRPELASAVIAEPETVMTIVIDLVDRGVASGEIAASAASQVVSMFLAGTIGLSLLASISGKPGLAEAAAGFTRALEGTLFDAPARRPRARGRTG